MTHGGDSSDTTAAIATAITITMATPIGQFVAIPRMARDRTCIGHACRDRMYGLDVPRQGLSRRSANTGANVCNASKEGFCGSVCIAGVLIVFAIEHSHTSWTLRRLGHCMHDKNGTPGQVSVHPHRPPGAQCNTHAQSSFSFCNRWVFLRCAASSAASFASTRAGDSRDVGRKSAGVSGARCVLLVPTGLAYVSPTTPRAASCRFLRPCSRPGCREAGDALSLSVSLNESYPAARPRLARRQGARLGTESGEKRGANDCNESRGNSRSDRAVYSCTRWPARAGRRCDSRGLRRGRLEPVSHRLLRGVYPANIRSALPVPWWLLECIVTGGVATSLNSCDVTPRGTNKPV